MFGGLTAFKKKKKFESRWRRNTRSGSPNLLNDDLTVSSGDKNLDNITLSDEDINGDSFWHKSSDIKYNR